MGKQKSDKSEALKVEARRDDTEAKAIARTMLRPTVNAAVAIQRFCKPAGKELDLNELITELSGQCAAVSNGDLTRSEAMLMAQAHTLDAIFANLAYRSAINIGDYLNAAETYMRLALKAQSQCRATLETLAAIKNPPTIIARQANVTTGPQQVNNGVEPGNSNPMRGDFDTSTRAGARENQNEQNKLLEATNGERLDIGSTGKAGGVDPQLEAVGTVNRSKIGGG